MFIDNAFVTTMNAQEIANIINHYYHTGGRNYFKLQIDTPRGTISHWVRPLLEATPYCLEDSAQIVRCETDEGQHLSLLIPRRDREYTPATAVFATSTGSAG